MKKIIKILTAMLSLILLVSVQPAKAEAATKPVVRVSKYRVTMYVGNQTQIKQTGSAKKYTWWSDNQKVAVVSSKGVIKAKRKGTATIVLKSGEKKSRCIVTVKAKPTAKQLVTMLEKQMSSYKNLSMTMYMDSVKYANMVGKIGLNKKDKIVYMNLFGIQAYQTPTKVYSKYPDSKYWYYEKNTEKMEAEDFEADLDLSSDAKYKVLSDGSFNGVKCTRLQMTEDGDKTIFYFSLKDNTLVGTKETEDGVAMYTKFDFETVIKVPASAKKNPKPMSEYMDTFLD